MTSIKSDSNSNTATLINTFNKQARWNFFGSMLYEGLRIGHSTVMAMLFTPQDFGLIGSLFASTYLVVRLSDAGATNALLPFFGYLEQSRKAFKTLFLKNLLLSLCFTAPVGASIAGVILYKNDNTVLSSCMIILPLLMVSETFRSFLRQFLHLAGKSKQTLLVDHVTFCLYVLFCWPTMFYMHSFRTPLFIFSLFLVDSLIGLCCFLKLVHTYAKCFPEDKNTVYSPLPTITIIKARLYGWALRISKELFSSNTLTPLFAATVGFKQAGLFYFAATLAMALHATMRSVIGYAGGSLFLTARKASLSSHQAFNLVSRKITRILVVLLLFFLFSYSDIIALTQSASTSPSLLMIFFVLYFSIVIIEFNLFLYEQQYFFEHAGIKALQWRFLELLLVYVTTKGFLSFSPISTLSCILLAKTGTLGALAFTGYKRWRIIPSLRMPIKTMVYLVIISIFLSIIFKVLVHHAFNI